MKFELQTLDSYEDDDLIEELRRVSDIVSGRLTMREFDEYSKVHSSTVTRRFNSWGDALEKAGLGKQITSQARLRTVSDVEIISLAKDVAQKLTTKTLTRKQFTEHTGIGSKAILTRFRSWKEVLQKAGLKTVALGRRYSDEECFENILNLWMHYGRQPNYAELNQPPSTVGAKAYVGRWGGWRKALKAFIKYTSNENQGAGHRESEKSSEPQNQAVNYERQGKSRTINLATRYKVLVRDNFKCVICGHSPALHPGITLHIDHILAWSKDGTNDPTNLRVLCSDCNLGKGDKNEKA